MSESHDMLMSLLNLTVTYTTYSLTVGGDSSESSEDAENSKATSSWERERRISCTTETGTKKSGTHIKVYIVMMKEIVPSDIQVLRGRFLELRTFLFPFVNMMKYSF